MQNILNFTDELNGKEYTVITYEDGSFTSMLKSDYDTQQAAQSLTNVPQAGANE